jgi:mannose-1-phosphate guanylyltransferase
VGPGGERLSPWHFTGVHVMTPAVFDFMKPSGPEDINREVYARMMEAGLVIRGVVAPAYWSDLGTPSRYLAAQQDLLLGKVSAESLGNASPFASCEKGPGLSWVRPPSNVNGRVVGPALFDTGCSVDESAAIGGGVYVGAKARIGAEARINRACVLEGTSIGAGEELVEQIAWGSHRIPAPLTPGK